MSMAGIEVDPDKTRAVHEFPIPLDIKSLRGFLGLTSYYRRFVESYSRLAKPLYHLTQKGVPYRWTPECQQAFDTLKAKLTSAPVLVYPDFEVPFVLETDASITVGWERYWRSARRMEPRVLLHMPVGPFKVPRPTTQVQS